jgi:hypothetical protein
METTLVATWDADVLVDHRSARPVMHLVEGVNTGLTWPAIELRHGRDPDGRDVLLLVGAEPDIRWRAFSADVVSLAGELGTRLAGRLRRLPGARAPHPPEPARGDGHLPRDRRPGRASSARRWTCPPVPSPPSSGRAPTPSCRPPGSGRRCRTTSPAMPYPDAAASLVEGFAALAGLRFDATPLREAARVLRVRLDGLVADNPEHQAMVTQLEASVDAELAAGSGSSFGGQVPSVTSSRPRWSGSCATSAATGAEHPAAVAPVG